MMARLVGSAAGLHVHQYDFIFILHKTTHLLIALLLQFSTFFSFPFVFIPRLLRIFLFLIKLEDTLVKLKQRMSKILIRIFAYEEEINSCFLILTHFEGTIFIYSCRLLFVIKLNESLVIKQNKFCSFGKHSERHLLGDFRNILQEHKITASKLSTDGRCLFSFGS